MSDIFECDSNLLKQNLDLVLVYIKFAIKACKNEEADDNFDELEVKEKLNLKQAIVALCVVINSKLNQLNSIHIIINKDDYLSEILTFLVFITNDELNEYLLFTCLLLIDSFTNNSVCLEKTKYYFSEQKLRAIFTRASQDMNFLDSLEILKGKFSKVKLI